MTIRFEQLALWVRYLVYGAGLGLYVTGTGRVNFQGLIFIGIVVVLHNAIVHVVLWRRYYAFFNSRWNFLLYLSEATLVVLFTGAEQSELNVLYYFLIGGSTLYSTRSEHIVHITGLCLLSYLGILCHEWLLDSLLSNGLTLSVKVASIPAVGWLTCTLMVPLQAAQELVRKRTRELSSSEAMLRSIFDATSQPVIAVDDRDIIYDVNRSVADFFEVSRETLLGKNVGSLLGTAISRKIISDVQNEGYSHAECELMAYWAQSRTLKLEAHPFFRHEKRFLVIVMHDITRQRLLEKTSEQTNMKLAHLNLELAQLSLMRGKLVSDLVERARSPLTAMLGYMEMLLQDETGPVSLEQRRVLLSCRISAQHLFELFEKASPVHEMESGRNHPEAVLDTSAASGASHQD